MLIAQRFCGPPDSANGGYTAGLLAKNLQGAVEVTLRRPPPLERELSLLVAEERARLCDGDLLIAEARRAAVELEPPPAPSFERAQALSKNYIGHTRHHFPSCFVCGPARAPGDGLRIFPGAERAGDPVAAPWLPDSSVADADGAVRQELLWAALDCIGYFAIATPDYPIALLGRMTGEIFGRVNAGARCVVVGFPLAREGRKLHAGTAIYDDDGKPLGVARQTWILLT
ncbi:MAG TPA: hypothetical protein VNG33_02120 [Polyangiaceae bacterium]|nr:hypothetical protein [Polyangiaceae bacterium]